MGIKCNLQKSNGKNVFPIIVPMGILLEKHTPLLRLLHLIHKGYNIPTIIWLSNLLTCVPDKVIQETYRVH
jgi:hypothetical protein